MKKMYEDKVANPKDFIQFYNKKGFAQKEKTKRSRKSHLQTDDMENEEDFENFEVNNFLYRAISKRDHYKNVHLRPINLDSSNFVSLIDQSVKTSNTTLIENFYDRQIYRELFMRVRDEIKKDISDEKLGKTLLEENMELKISELTKRFMNELNLAAKEVDQEDQEGTEDGWKKKKDLS